MCSASSSMLEWPATISTTKIKSSHCLFWGGSNQFTCIGTLSSLGNGSTSHGFDLEWRLRQRWRFCGHKEAASCSPRRSILSPYHRRS
jgi:hypothetical protein